MDMQLYFVLLTFWGTLCSAQFRPTRFRLTAERGGPPQGAQFVPIPTITGFPTGPRPFKRPQPITGIPPPPPEPSAANTEEPVTLPITMAPPTLTITEETSTDFLLISSSSSATPPPPPPPTNMAVSVTQPPSTYKPITTSTVATPTSSSSSPKDDGLVYNLYSQDDDGSYYFEYLTKQAAHRKEQGFFKRESGFQDKVHVKTGLYSFISPEGTPVRVDYIADENGYRAYESSRVARKFANTRRHL
ncbi:endocuticle structural glycoprotein SgAbd-1-like [Nilaparvata lugens]|uniref:endocuticle structural glycoprotein SgAbd-1-like n=1 Tax=Nilaparvata lugens TaxID=108931 RepID=UPI00193E356D|nr:endocuticle structural glycoprotein SgAbd-1-like [Nilaparvata lugens]